MTEIVSEKFYKDGFTDLGSHHYLHVAACSDHPKSLYIMETELKNGTPVDICTRNKEKWTPLHMAAMYNQIPAAKLLLSWSADVNLRCHDLLRNTPLHLAIISAGIDMVKVLLEAKANPLLVDCARRTPLDATKHSDRPEIVSLLEDGQKIQPSPVAPPAPNPFLLRSPAFVEDSAKQVVLKDSS